MLTAYTNGGGAHRYEKMAKMELLPLKVQYKEASLSNILSLKATSDINDVMIMMDTDCNKSIFIKIKNEETLDFKQFSNCLYYLDTDTLDSKINI